MLIKVEPMSTAVISIIFAATIVVTLTGLGIVDIGTAQGQGNPTLTPEQKAAMCDPNDSFVNTTESRICGIPKTPAAPAANTSTTTTGTETETTSPSSSSTSIAPSAGPSS